MIISWESFICKHPKVKQILPQNPYNRETEPEKLYDKDYVKYKKVDFSKLIEAVTVQPNTKEQELKSALAAANINESVIKTII